jgi:PAS domain S-box-containing protein
MARGANNQRAVKLHTMLKSHIGTMPELSVLHLTNAKGEHIHSSLDSVPGVNISDRYHFQHQRDDPNAGLVISPPLISRTTGKWTLILTRRINFDDGSFAGIVNAILDPEYFQKFYQSLDMGKHGAITLYDKELHLVTRYPQSEKDIGKIIPHDSVKTYIEKGIKQANYHAKSPVDGVDRMYSFRQVGDLPLFVIAGLAPDDYLAEWRLHAWEYGIGAVILSFVVVGFGWREFRSVETQRKNTLLLNSIIENIPNMIFLKRASDLRFELFNRAGEMLLGHKRDGLLRRNDYDFFPKEQADFFASKDRAVLERSDIVDIPEESIDTPLGTRILHTKKLALRDENGQPQYLLGISEDITDRIQAERDLQQAYQKLQQSQELLVRQEKLASMGTLVGGVAHEINNPLMGISGYISYAIKNIAEDEPREMLGKAQKEVDRIARIVRSMLVFGRQSDPTKQQADAINVLKNISALIEGEFKAANIILRIEFPSELPTVNINADTLQQILLNLLLNARDALKDIQAPREVLIRMEEVNGNVEISVSDNGPGVPADALPRIFDPFFTTKDPGSGTGLGLAVSRQMAEEAGGTLEYRATPTGACFVIGLFYAKE